MDPVYISHGSPMLPLEDIPARDFLRKWQQDFVTEKPKAILAISAHWETTHPTVNTTSRHSTIYDFYGFPSALYKLQYNAPGAPELARQVKGLLQTAGFTTVQEDTKRGLDHGAWVPLYLMYPDADIPVCQLSLQSHKGALYHYKLGQALSSLKNEGILIMASGSATHNLNFISNSNTPPSWMVAFDKWLSDALLSGRFEDVIDYEKKAPYARKTHPSPEHFYPLLVAIGAAGPNSKTKRLHASWAHSSLSMASFSFKSSDEVGEEKQGEIVQTESDNGVGPSEQHTKKGNFLGRLISKATKGYA